jgi:hypothetical protein
MTTEFRINGSYALHLTPKTDTERHILAEMAQRAKSGQTVTLTVTAEDGTVAVKVEA